MRPSSSGGEEFASIFAGAACPAAVEAFGFVGFDDVDGLVSEPVADAGAVGQFVASGLAVRPAHRREHASGQAIRSFARRMARGRVPAPMKESMSSSLAWSILSASGAGSPR